MSEKRGGQGDGIEPPTQAFSGFWLLGPCYFAPAKSSFLISEH